MEATLFDVPIFEEPKQPKGTKCSKCKHCYKHEYGKMLYCNLRTQKNTAYGNLKVKAKDWCNLFENK